MEKVASFRIFPWLIAAAICASSAASARAQDTDAHCVIQAPPTDSSRYRVTGRVVEDLTGRPIAHAEVRLAVFAAACSGKEPDDRLKYDGPESVQTDDEGAFAFPDVPAVEVTLQATKEHYFSADELRRLPNPQIGLFQIGRDAGPITLRIVGTSSFYGIARDENEKPIGGVQVALYSRFAWAGWLRIEYAGNAETHPDGSFTFPDLRPGRYYLVADPPHAIPWTDSPARDAEGNAVGYVPVRFPASADADNSMYFSLHEGERARADFHFRKARLYRVSGTIPGMRNPTTSTNLRDANESAAYILKAQPGEEAFESWLPDGTYSIEVRNAENNGADTFEGWDSFEVTGSDLSGIEIPMAPVKAVDIPVEVSSGARGANPSDPCGGIELVECGFPMLDLEGPMSGPESRLPTVVSSISLGHQRDPQINIGPGSGKFRVTLVSSSNVYAASVTSGTTDLIKEPLVVAADHANAPIKVVLAEGGIVEGVTREGEKTAAAWIYFLPEEANSNQFYPRSSAADGTFHIEGLAPGRYFAWATDDDILLDRHNPAETEPWIKRATLVTIEAGKTTSVDLRVIHCDIPE